MNNSKVVLLIAIAALVAFMCWIPLYAIMTTGKSGWGWVYVFNLIVFDYLHDIVMRILR